MDGRALPTRLPSGRTGHPGHDAPGPCVATGALSARLTSAGEWSRSWKGALAASTEARFCFCSKSANADMWQRHAECNDSGELLSGERLSHRWRAQPTQVRTTCSRHYPADAQEILKTPSINNLDAFSASANQRWPICCYRPQPAFGPLGGGLGDAQSQTQARGQARSVRRSNAAPHSSPSPAGCLGGAQRAEPYGSSAQFVACRVEKLQTISTSSRKSEGSSASAER
jgi:hypothetical protein